MSMQDDRTPCQPPKACHTDPQCGPSRDDTNPGPYNDDEDNNEMEFKAIIDCHGCLQ